MDLDSFDIFEAEEDEVYERKSKKAKLDQEKLSTEEVGDVLIEDADSLDLKNNTSELVTDFDDAEINLTNLNPKVAIHQLEADGGCLHEVVVPIDCDYIPLRNHQEIEGFQPAKKYEFVLDPFQREAISCIENNQSVMVSAHTSAGKTVVAEYAIAASLRDKQRVIYTTPIKALSNQKYREFFEEFRDVGLITGDVTINPSASCLIMTTEILRLMLFRGNDIMREVGWVIFDEIHYMRDKERGVVWEEAIILLPDTVHHVFLSATIPNARQFAEWISHLHHQPCHVVYTDYRPVPLQHYIYPAQGAGLHLVVDELGNFKEESFNKAMSTLQNATGPASGQPVYRKATKSGEQSSVFQVVKAIMEKELAPVIVFSFSKKECEAYALELSRLDCNTSKEKDLVQEVFTNAIDILSEDDKKLPQVEHVLPLLKRGIGIHHSGLLPIIKETIEILFGEGLIKTLFATETFAMGLNMPARTVVFTSARKFDGQTFRWITSGEYIQMSGRAGRRGIDKKGIVILMVDEKMSPAVGKDLIKGKPDPLNSAFHLTYNMVLNLLRVEDVNPEYMLQHSFYQFQHYAQVPSLLERLKKLEEERDSIKIEEEQKVSDYFKIKAHYSELAAEYSTTIRKPLYCLPFLQSGRLIKFTSDEGFDLGWGAVVNYHKKTLKNKNPAYEDTTLITIDTLLYLDPASIADGFFKAPQEGKPGEVIVVTLNLNNLLEISGILIFVPEDIKNFDSRQSVHNSIKSVLKKFKNKLPLIDPINDMKIRDKKFQQIVAKMKQDENRLAKFDEINSFSMELFAKKQAINAKIPQVKSELRKAQSLLQMDELKCRKRVLRRLGYCTASDVIEIKGRVACEITSGDELLITEMLFNGQFNDLNSFQIAALLSCFVFEEKAEKIPQLSEELEKPLKAMQELGRRIATVSKEARLDIDEQKYIEQFKPSLMDVIYAWTKGATFGQLCLMTDVFEGSIIRCMRRLEELLRQMVQAAKVIGNTDLENKFAEADKLIKRDIGFAASLYL